MNYAVYECQVAQVADPVLQDLIYSSLYTAGGDSNVHELVRRSPCSL